MPPFSAQDIVYFLLIRGIIWVKSLVSIIYVYLRPVGLGQLFFKISAKCRSRNLRITDVHQFWGYHERVHRKTSCTAKHIGVFAQAVERNQSAHAWPHKKGVFTAFICREILVYIWFQLIYDELQIAVCIHPRGVKFLVELTKFCFRHIVKRLLRKIIMKSAFSNIPHSYNYAVSYFAFSYQCRDVLVNLPFLTIPRCLRIKKHLPVVHIHNIVSFLWRIILRNPHINVSCLNKWSGKILILV